MSDDNPSADLPPDAANLVAYIRDQQQLPDEIQANIDRAIHMLVDQHGLSNRRVAEVLGFSSENTIRKALSRARREPRVDELTVSNGNT